MPGYVPSKIVHQPIESRGSVGDQALVSNKDLYIDFFHVATGKCVSFKGFVTAFDDTYQANWNSEQVYGRMDPIMTYQSTVRTISIAWDVVAVSLEEAQSNLHAIEHLMSMMYPVYKAGKAGKIETLEASPLMKIKFANFIRQGGAEGVKPQASDGGLVGVIESLSYAPDFEPGFFLPGAGQIYPKSVSINCQFTVLHTHKLGWRKGKKKKIEWRGDIEGKGNDMAFPYGVDALTGKFSTCEPGKPRRFPPVPAPTSRSTKGTDKVDKSNVGALLNPNIGRWGDKNG